MTPPDVEADPREQFIPVRKGAIVEALLADPKFADSALAASFRQFCGLLGAIFHHEHFDELDALKEAYHRFNPHHPGPPEPIEEAAYAEFLSTLRRMLAKANFVEVSESEMALARSSRALFDVAVHADTGSYRHILFFRRGRHLTRIERREWMGLRVREVEVDVHHDVIMVVSLRHEPPVAAKRLPWLRRRPDPHRPGSVLIKYFRDIPAADLDTLLPDVRVVMGNRDRWMIGIPALFGGIPLLLKLGPTLAVLAIVFGVGLGAGQAVEGDRVEQALVVTSGLIALGGFITHQWVKYQRKALRYQLEIKGNIYFRNVSNNAGIFDAIVGAAEEQECKEAILAYAFLLGEPASRHELDRKIEAWLHARFGKDIDFEIDDGLGKLDRLGLLTETAAGLTVPPLPEALRRLGRCWGGFFDSGGAESAPPGESRLRA